MSFNTTTVEQDYDAIVTLIFREQVDQYFNVASVAYWVYECFITIIPEIMYIWSSPWSIIKVLYLITKYSPIIDSALAIAIFVPTHASVSICTKLYIAGSIFLYLGIVLAEVMLVYRVWVVWNRDKCLGIGLFIFGFISTCAATGLTLALVESFVVVAPQPPLGCTVVSAIGSLQVATLSFTFGYAFVLTILMTIQYIQTRREGPYAGAFVRGAQLDGLIPYLFVLLVSFCSLLTTIFAAPAGYGAILLRIQRITHSLVACRVILQTKARHRKQQKSFLVFVV